MYALGELHLLGICPCFRLARGGGLSITFIAISGLNNSNVVMIIVIIHTWLRIRIVGYQLFF